MGFLDCWIFLTTRTSKNKEMLKGRHLLMLELMRDKIRPNPSLELDQLQVNETVHKKIYKDILNIAENMLTEEGIKKMLKNANFDTMQL